MEYDRLHCLIRYCVGQRVREETSVLVNSLKEARDFAHMSLRLAVQIQESDNGAAELFDADSGEKLGRMAVLFDEPEEQETGVDHEQWTWVPESARRPLH